MKYLVILVSKYWGDEWLIGRSTVVSLRGCRTGSQSSQPFLSTPSCSAPSVFVDPHTEEQEGDFFCFHCFWARFRLHQKYTLRLLLWKALMDIRVEGKKGESQEQVVLLWIRFYVIPSIYMLPHLIPKQVQQILK